MHAHLPSSRRRLGLPRHARRSTAHRPELPGGNHAALSWEREAARSYADLRVACELNGVSLAPVDTMIAAHAVAADATLVTRNKAFGRVPAQLKTEDSATLPQGEPKRCRSAHSCPLLGTVSVYATPHGAERMRPRSFAKVPTLQGLSAYRAVFDESCTDPSSKSRKLRLNT